MNALPTTAFLMRRELATARFSLRNGRAWLPLAVLPAVVYCVAAAHVSPWQMMWLVAAAIYVSFKWLAWWSAKLTNAGFARKLLWWIGWIGMDPARFLSSDPPPPEQRPNLAKWRYAARNALAGVALFIGGSFLIFSDWQYLGGWCGMFGVVLMLHFGAFHALSCGWRAAGVSAMPIMDRPFTSNSLGEFWGRRWNRAFRDAAYMGLFQPLAKRFGSTTAMCAVFLFSGAVHEVCISLPAGGGYGMPTLYFMSQAAMLMAQNSAWCRRIGIDRGWRGRGFTLAAVFGPLPLLFHPPFVQNVIIPMVRAFAPL